MIAAESTTKPLPASFTCKLRRLELPWTGKDDIVNGSAQRIPQVRQLTLPLTWVTLGPNWMRTAAGFVTPSKCPAAMPQREKDCYVNGDRFCELMCNSGMNEAQLADKLGFAVQTIRNYLSSTLTKPWKASLKKVHQLATVFNADVRDLMLDIGNTPVDSLTRAIDAAEHRFMGDPLNCRSIAGIWECTSEDVPIPGQLEYTHTIPWAARSEITQTGSRFEAKGLDKDEDVILARGALLENGNFVRFTYFVEHRRLRQYGSGLLEFKGDGKTMEGYFLGRDAGQSTNGLLLAKIIFKLVETL